MVGSKYFFFFILGIEKCFENIVGLNAQASKKKNRSASSLVKFDTNFGLLVRVSWRGLGQITFFQFPKSYIDLISLASFFFFLLLYPFFSYNSRPFINCFPRIIASL